MFIAGNAYPRCALEAHLWRPLVMRRSLLERVAAISTASAPGVNPLCIYISGTSGYAMWHSWWAVPNAESPSVLEPTPMNPRSCDCCHRPQSRPNTVNPSQFTTNAAGGWRRGIGTSLRFGSMLQLSHSPTHVRTYASEASVGLPLGFSEEINALISQLSSRCGGLFCCLPPPSLKFFNGFCRILGLELEHVCDKMSLGPAQ